MRKRFPTIVIIGCLLLGFVSATLVRFELLPSKTVNSMVIRVDFPTGTSIEHMESIGYEVLKRIEEKPFVLTAYLSGGIDPLNFSLLSDPETKIERIVIRAKISLDTFHYDEAALILRNALESTSFSVMIIPDEDFLSQVLKIKVNEIIVSSTTQESALAAARAIEDEENNIFPYEVSNDFTFVPDRVANSRFGITAMQTASVASSALEGVSSAPFFEDGIQIPVLVLFDEKYRDEVEKITDVHIGIEGGSMIPLKAFGSLERREYEKILYRYNRKDSKIVRTSFSEILDEIPGVEYIDVRKDQINDMLDKAFLLLIGIIVLLYLIMAAQFENMLIPLILLIAILPSFSGALITLVVFDYSLNINSIISLVLLFGVSVGNSILLYEACIISNASSKESVEIAVCSKFRAILVTNTTTIIALLPFAIDLFGNNSQASLSLSLIGGLLLSSLVVLFVIPYILSKIFSRTKIGTQVKTL